MKLTNGNIDYQIALLKKVIQCIELDDLLDLLTEELLKIKGFSGFTMAFVDEDFKNLIIKKCHFQDDFRHMGNVIMGNIFPVNDQEDDYAICYQKKRSFILEKSKINEHNETTQRRFYLWQMESCAFIPIKTKDTVYGVIAPYCIESVITEETVKKFENILSIFIDQIINSLNYSNLQERDKENKTISIRNKRILELAERINNLTSIEVIYQMILGEIISLFGFNVAAVFIDKGDMINYITGLSSNDEYSKNIFTKFDKYFFDIEGYEKVSSDGATATSVLTGNHFYFKDLTPILKLPMAEKDKNGIEILKTPCSLLILPIMQKEKSIGAFQLWSVNGNHVDLNEADLKILRSLSGFIGTAIANSELYSLVEKQKAKLLSDLDIARKIQESIIKTIPDTDHLHINSRYIAMESVGGDLYDVRRIGRNSYSFMISDVSGHGVPAALITTMAKTSFINHSHFSKTSSITCKEVNDDLFNLIGDTRYYLTAFFATLDMATMELSYTNCGHQLPLLYRDKTGEIEELDTQGLYIGIVDEAGYETKSLKLNIKDKLLMFTDGITEARNGNNEFYTNERLNDFLKKNGHKTPDIFLQELMDDVESFCGEREPDDDRAILLIEIIQTETSEGEEKTELFVDGVYSHGEHGKEHEVEIFRKRFNALGFEDKSLDEQISEADSLYKNESYKDAEEILRKLLPYFPENIKILSNLGLTYLKMKKYRHSLEVYKKIKSIKPEYNNIDEIISKINSLI